MKTLDTNGAAALLFCSEDRVLDLIAKKGLPACNETGRGWVFVDVDLIEWLRAHYVDNAGGRSTERIGPRSSSSASIRKRYEKAIGQAVRGERDSARVKGSAA